MNKTIRSIDWKPEEDAYLYEHYPIKGARICSRDMNKKLKTTRTHHAVYSRAKRLGIHFDPCLQFSLKEISHATNVSIKSILQLIKSRKIPYRKKQNKVFVNIEYSEYIIDYYKQKQSVDTKGFMSTKESSDALGCDPTAIRHAVRTNKMPFKKKGHIMFIDKRIVDLALKQLKDTGEIKVNWRNVKKEYESIYLTMEMNKK